MRRLSYGFFVILIAGCQSWAQESSEDIQPYYKAPVIRVVGRGTASTKPDYAEFTLTVSSNAKQSETVVKSHDGRIVKALSALKEAEQLGLTVKEGSYRLIKKESSSPLPVREMRRIQQDAPTKVLPPEYYAITEYRVKIENLDNLDKIFTGLINANAFDETARVRYFVIDERTSLNEARRAAARDAKEQAEAYADAVGQRLKEVWSITDGEAIPADGLADLPIRGYIRRPGVETTVQLKPPAFLDFTASVQIVWRIEPK